MLKKIFCVCIIAVFAISLAGCITVRKNDLERQGLKNQIQALEVQLQEKDREITNLRESLTKEIREKEETNKKVSEAKVIGEVKSRPNVRQIQIALKNAGYDPGRIDGKMGKKTREAIKAFQKAKGLAVDGKMGNLTWNLLRDYLYTKAK